MRVTLVRAQPARAVKPDASWSALNREVEIRYRACLANGGHVGSGAYVNRPSGQTWLTPLEVCGRCEVPFRPAS